MGTSENRIENKDSAIKIERYDNEYLKIEIRASSSNFFVLGVLLTLSVFCFFLPLSILLISAIDVGIGFVFTLILFWGSSIFFIRNFLWNMYGKEIYKISSSNLDYYYDYRFFKDNLTKVELDSLKIGYCMKDAPNDVILYSKDDMIIGDDCYLVFVNNDKLIKSNIAINYKEISKIAKVL